MGSSAGISYYLALEDLYMIHNTAIQDVVPLKRETKVSIKLANVQLIAHISQSRHPPNRAPETVIILPSQL